MFYIVDDEFMVQGLFGSVRVVYGEGDASALGDCDVYMR